MSKINSQPVFVGADVGASRTKVAVLDSDKNLIYLNFSIEGLSRIDTTITIDSIFVRSSTINSDSLIDFQRHNVAQFYLNE